MVSFDITSLENCHKFLSVQLWFNWGSCAKFASAYRKTSWQRCPFQLLLSRPISSNPSQCHLTAYLPCAACVQISSLLRLRNGLHTFSQPSTPKTFHDIWPTWRREWALYSIMARWPWTASKPRAKDLGNSGNLSARYGMKSWIFTERTRILRMKRWIITLRLMEETLQPAR